MTLLYKPGSAPQFWQSLVGLEESFGDAIHLQAGQSWLICPALIELDQRFGQHPSKWEPCWHGRQETPDGPRVSQPCLREHEHQEPAPDGGGHACNGFSFQPGVRPYRPEEWPHCDCGRALVHADLDPPGSLHDPELCPRPDCADKRSG